MRHFFAFVAIGCLGVLAPRSASAQDATPLRLEWEGPAVCPDQGQVLDRVRSYLKLDRWPASPTPRVVARGRVTPREQQLSLELEVSAPNATTRRTWTDADCEALANGAALLIAMALEPVLNSQSASVQPVAPGPESEGASGAVAEGRGAESDGPSPPPATAPLPPRQTVRAPDAPAEGRASARVSTSGDRTEEPETKVRSGRPARFALGGGPWLASDLMPAGPALGIELAGELRVGPFRVGLGLALAPRRTDRISSYPNAQLRMSSAMLVLWPCYELPAEPLTLGLCLHAELGRVDAEVRSIAEPQSSHSRWLAAGAGISLGYAASRHLLVLLEGRILRAAEDLHFVIATPGGEVELHRTGPLSARLSLRLEWQF